MNAKTRDYKKEEEHHPMDPTRAAILNLINLAVRRLVGKYHWRAWHRVIQNYTNAAIPRAHRAAQAFTGSISCGLSFIGDLKK